MAIAIEEEERSFTEKKIFKKLKVKISYSFIILLNMHFYFILFHSCSNYNFLKKNFFFGNLIEAKKKKPLKERDFDKKVQ